MNITPRPSTFTRTLGHAADQFQALRSQLAGQLITAADADFDAARKLRYIDIDRRPLAVVRAANAHDVAATVRFANQHGLPLAVRSGGHSLAYHSMIDNALVLDLSRLKRIDIDPEKRIARVQPGATSGDLAGPAHTHGLALSTGDTHSVGMGGLTTGGGIGLMVRKFGLAIDNLVAAQVVTAQGELVSASASEHSDLFWAIRGGGGNFGVVTEFTYRLAPVDQIMGGYLFLPASREVIRGYLDYAVAAPDELTTIADVMRAPPAPFMPADRVGELVLAILVCWTGSEADGQQALAPLRALVTPVAEAIGMMPYPDIYELTAEIAGPHGKAIRSMFANELSDATLDAALAALEQASSPYSVVEFRALGGAMARVGNHETAFAHRDKRYFFAVIGLWFDPAEDPTPHQAWTEALWQVVRHEGSGVYVNFLENEGPERVRDAYPPATYRRLVEVKRAYDPHNLFRFNQNIPPKL